MIWSFLLPAPGRPGEPARPRTHVMVSLSHVAGGGPVAAPHPDMRYAGTVREQFWFWYGYRPGIRTVARQTMR